MEDLRTAAEKANIPYRTAARWVEQGLIKVKGLVGRQGNPIPWTPKQTRELTVLAHLRDQMSMQELRKAAEFLQERGHNPFSTGEFLVVQGRPGKKRLIRIAKDRSEALEVIGKHKGQLSLIPIILHGPKKEEPKKIKKA